MVVKIVRSKFKLKWQFFVKLSSIVKGKGVPLHAMEVHGGEDV
jgi:hypothetical protein